MTNIIPRLLRLDEATRRELVGAFQSISANQQAAVQQAASVQGASAQQWFSLAQRVDAIGAQVGGLLQAVRALQRAPSSPMFPLAGSFDDGGDVVAFCVVYESSPGTASLADPGTVTDPASIIGICTAVPGKVQATLIGDVSNPDWNWAAGEPVFLGVAGALTQVPPDVFRPIVVGDATDTQTIFVNPRVLDIAQSINKVPAAVLAYTPGDYNLIAARGLRLDGTLRIDGQLILGI